MKHFRLDPIYRFTIDGHERTVDMGRVREQIKVRLAAIGTDFETICDQMACGDAVVAGPASDQFCEVLAECLSLPRFDQRTGNGMTNVELIDFFGKVMRDCWGTR